VVDDRKDSGDLYLRAMESGLGLVTSIKADQWHNVTPCDEWDLRVLLNHITSENLWLAEMFSGKTMEDVGASLDGDVLGDDPIAAFTGSVAAAKRALQIPGALEATHGLSSGDFSGYAYAHQLFMDQLVHSWDVTKGSGQGATLDEELVEICIPFAEQVIAAVGQGRPLATRRNTHPTIGRRSVCSPSSAVATIGRPPVTTAR